MSSLPIGKPYLISALFTGPVAIFLNQNDVRTDLCAGNAVFFLLTHPSIWVLHPRALFKRILCD